MGADEETIRCLTGTNAAQIKTAASAMLATDTT
jgi:hypothetical protein